ncbi:MAG: TfoX/Sxy family protein [Acidobacteriota bacterium]
MASDLEFVEFVVEQIGEECDVTYKHMFGEYGLYSKGKIVAVICDNRLYMKPTDAGRSFIGEPVEAPPYPGASDRFLIEEQIEDRDWLTDLVKVTEAALPAPKPRKRKKKPGTRKKAKKTGTRQRK